METTILNTADKREDSQTPFWAQEFWEYFEMSDKEDIKEKAGSRNGVNVAGEGMICLYCGEKRKLCLRHPGRCIQCWEARVDSGEQAARIIGDCLEYLRVFWNITCEKRYETVIKRGGRMGNWGSKDCRRPLGMDSVIIKEGKRVMSVLVKGDLPCQSVETSFIRAFFERYPWPGSDKPEVQQNRDGLAWWFVVHYMYVTGREAYSHWCEEAAKENENYEKWKERLDTPFTREVISMEAILLYFL